MTDSTLLSIPSTGVVGSTPSQAYTEYSFSYTATSNFTYINFEFQQIPSTLYLDGVSFKAAAGTELLQNGGFDTGTYAGWTYFLPPGVSASGSVYAAGYNSTYAWADGAVQNFDGITQGVTTVAGVTYTLSFYFKNDGGNALFKAIVGNSPALGLTINKAVLGQTTADTAALSPFSSTTILDTAAAQTQTVTVTPSSTANGTLSDPKALGTVTSGSYHVTGTAAQVTAAIQGLVFTPKPNLVTPGQVTTTTFTITSVDAAGNTAKNLTTTVLATSVNDAPMLGGLTSGQAVTDKATLAPFATATITDPDVGQTQRVTISYSAANGTFANLGAFSGSAGSYTATGAVAAVQAALRALVFIPTANQVTPGSTVTTAFTVTDSDGTASATSSSATVVASSVNDAPKITGTTATLATTDTTPASPLSTITLSDPDVGQTQTATLTLSAANGVLSNVGSGTLSSDGLSYVVSGTAANVQSALRALVFTPTQNQVAPGNQLTTTFALTINDGIVSSSASIVLNVAAINGAPIIGGVVNSAAADTASFSPFSTITLSDPTASPTETATLSISAANGILSNLGTGMLSGDGLNYVVSGAASDVQATLAGLVYTPTPNQVTPGSSVTTTFALVVDNGAQTSSASAAVSTVSVNDAPVIGGVANQAVTGTADINPLAAVTLTDVDVGQTETATLTVSEANGVLSNPASGTLGGDGLSYVVSGTTADVQAALRALVFSPGQGQDSQATTVFALDVSDGMASSSSSSSVTVMSGNSAPVIDGVTTSATTDAAMVNPLATVTVSDADVGQTETATLTLSASHGVISNLGSGTLSGDGLSYVVSGSAADIQAGLRALVFTPVQNQVTPGDAVTTTFALSVSDGIASTNASTIVTATSVNDAPVIIGLTAVTTTDTVPVLPLSGIGISDPDVGQTETATLTLSAANGVLSGLGNGTLSGDGLSYAVSGSAEDVQAALRGLVFTPVQHQVTPANAVSTGITLSVSDGSQPATLATGSIAVTSVENAPTLLGTAVNQVTTSGVGIAPFTTVALSDPDANAAETVTIMLLDAAGQPADANGTLSGIGLSKVAPGTYQLLTGAPAAVQAALRAISFIPTADQAPAGTTITTQLQLSVSDGIAPPVVDGTTSIVAGDSDPATVSGLVTTPPDADLSSGATVLLSLAFSHPVFVTGGVPSLHLSNGGIAPLVGGSGTGVLSFGYTVLLGQDTADLASTGLSLNGATIRDEAGNSAVLSSAAANPAGILQIDTIPPVVSLLLANDTGRSASDAITGNPAFTGTAEANSLVTISNGSSTLGTTTSDATGMWRFTPVLPDGPYTLTAAQTDAAGNTGTAKLAFTLDTTSPALTMAIASGDATLSGTTDPGGVVAISNGATLLGTATADARGQWSLTPALADGTYSLTASQTDAAGNLGAATLSFTLSHPFAALIVTNPDKTEQVTVVSQVKPVVAGAYSVLGGGTISADGQSYTVSGTTAAVNAALGAVVFTQLAGSTPPVSFSTSVHDTAGTSALANSGGSSSLLQATAAGDVVVAGTGTDTLVAAAGGTRLVASSGNTTLLGHATGSSTLVGGTGNSLFVAQGGTTRIEGGTGKDTISANTGDVTIVTGTGGSLVSLGTGIALVNGQGADTIVAGSGAVIIGAATGSLVALGTGTGVVLSQGGTTVVGGAGDDTIGVSGAGALVFAGPGHSTFIGGTGGSTVSGGAGTSTIFGMTGGGLFAGGAGGNNIIVAGQQATTIIGGSGGGDILFANGSAADLLVAGAGNTTLQGSASTGDDTFITGSGNALIGLGTGRDVVYGGSGNCTVVSGAGRDVYGFVNGAAGGTEVITGFKVGQDLIGLQGYTGNELSRALATARTDLGSATSAPGTTITLSDNTRINFAGVSSVDARIFG